MKLQTKIFIFIFIGAGVLIYKNKGIEKMGKLARGIRNNNPMNLRKTTIPWNGKVEGTDKSFETFIDAKHGIRAGAKTLLTYQNKYGLNTVNEIINRFAPPFENDTNSYAQHVAKNIGVNIDTPINVSENLFPLISAIIKHENGVNPYSDDTIRGGISLV